MVGGGGGGGLAGEEEVQLRAAEGVALVLSVGASSS